MTKKVPAFTLIEVTIAMLIAAIAISITYTAYGIISGLYSRYTLSQQKISNLVLADKLLKQDFLSAKSAERLDDGLVLNFEDGVIAYTVEPHILIRNQFTLRIDTFKLELNDIDYSFEGQSVVTGDKVDRLTFSVAADGGAIPFTYSKLYSANDLFQ